MFRTCPISCAIAKMGAIDLIVISRVLNLLWLNIVGYTVVRWYNLYVLAMRCYIYEAKTSIRIYLALTPCSSI